MRARAFRTVAVLVCAVSSSLVACSRVGGWSRSSSFAIIDSLEAAPGATSSEFGGVLASDVVTRVAKTVGGQPVTVPTVFQDAGRVTMHLALWDPGTLDKPAAPSTTNTVTLTRYHVAYMRADGRNIPGVDVPYAFDGALTLSLTGGDAPAATFVLVRAQAKDEAPLKALAGGGGAIVISTIAEVTFYGADQAGRVVTVTGYIGINFSDWADPN